jgi:hypothetical protein
VFAAVGTKVGTKVGTGVEIEAGTTVASGLWVGGAKVAGAQEAISTTVMKRNTGIFKSFFS